MTLLYKLVGVTYYVNNRSVGYTLLALVTKLLLSIIWLLSTSGKTGSQRRANRQQTLLIMLVPTSIIGLLVAALALSEIICNWRAHGNSFRTKFAVVRS